MEREKLTNFILSSIEYVDSSVTSMTQYVNSFRRQSSQLLQIRMEMKAANDVANAMHSEVDEHVGDACGRFGWD